MKHAATQELYAYWRSLCRGRSAPERNDIDPAAIRGVLADTFMIEVDGARPSARLYPIRVSGTRMNAVFDRELKGTSFLALWDHRDRADAAALIAAVLDDATPAIGGCLGAPAGHRPVGFELLLLPLRHRGRTHARLLGALSPRTVPSWLGLLQATALTLSSQRMIGSADAEQATPSAPSDATSRTPGVRRTVRRAHFIVHDGGRSDEHLIGERLRAI